MLCPRTRQRMLHVLFFSQFALCVPYNLRHLLSKETLGAVLRGADERLEPYVLRFL
jgi:hypothetical protein